LSLNSLAARATPSPTRRHPAAWSAHICLVDQGRVGREVLCSSTSLPAATRATWVPFAAWGATPSRRCVRAQQRRSLPSEIEVSWTKTTPSPRFASERPLPLRRATSFPVSGQRELGDVAGGAVVTEHHLAFLASVLLTSRAESCRCRPRRGRASLTAGPPGRESASAAPEERRGECRAAHAPRSSRSHCLSGERLGLEPPGPRRMPSSRASRRTSDATPWP